jgi:hypothetical protein
MPRKDLKDKYLARITRGKDDPAELCLKHSAFGAVSEVKLILDRESTISGW